MPFYVYNAPGCFHIELQSWVVAIETIGPRKPGNIAIQNLTEMFANPCSIR